jgi:PKD repeat protein
MIRKILTITILGLLILSAGGSTGSLLDADIEHEKPTNTSNILISNINVKVKDKLLTDEAGYLVSYFMIAVGNHEVACNIDYEVWHGGNFDYGVHEVGKTLSLGIITISFGLRNYYWESFDIGSFEGTILIDGEIAATDFDNETDDNGEFEVDAKGDYDARIGEVIEFEGYAKGGVEPYNWSWDFGDGNTSDEQFPTHYYISEGEFPVTLTVTDANGSVANDTTRSKIEQDFEADAGGDYDGQVGETIQFEGKAEHGIEPYSWYWDFGDGNTSTEEDPEHAYYAVGEYNITLTVTDDVGNTATDNAVAYIYNEFEIDAGDEYDGIVNETVQFNGKADGGIEPYTWYWEFGDGYNSTEQEPEHAYAAAGNYTATLTVTDNIGNSATDTAPVYITVE